MLFTLLNRLTAIKKISLTKLFQEQFRYIGVPGVYIPNKHLPTPYRMKNPLAGSANY